MQTERISWTDQLYHHFIPHYADIVRPLHTLLATTKTKQLLAWDDNTLKALMILNKRLEAHLSFFILQQMFQLTS